MATDKISYTITRRDEHETITRTGTLKGRFEDSSGELLTFIPIDGDEKARTFHPDEITLWERWNDSAGRWDVVDRDAEVEQ